MKTIPLTPTKSQISTAFVGIAAIAAATLLIPGFFFVSAFLMPVLVCPLTKKPDRKTAIGLIVALLTVPFSAWFHYRELMLTLAVLGAVSAPVVITPVLLKEQGTLSPKNQKEYLAAYVFGEVLVLLWVMGRFSGNIAEGLADMIVARLEKTPFGLPFFEQMVYMGLLPSPEGVFTEEALLREFILLTRPRIQELLVGLLARIVTWTAITASLFTVLRVSWANNSFLLVREEGSKSVTVARPVVFSMLALRKRSMLLLAGAGLLASLLLVGQEGLAGILGELIVWTVLCILTLAGAAALLRAMNGWKGRPAAWQGLIAGVLMITSYSLLMLFLFVEPMILLFRRKKPEDDKEEEP